ncbi:MAG: serine/threonine-protein kinase [Planctomycetota bacterium]
MRFAFAPESKPLEGYTIKRAIHRGGFGEVYYALTDAGKEVALKLLHNNLEVELRGVSQCLNLKHPNLVTIFDMKQDAEKDHWIVMEYVGGRGLYEVLQDYPTGMPLQEVLFWLSGITAGLSFLHDRGIVHRDLKPANIFCDSGIVKIGDVGLSKYISESRRSAQTQSVGTVYYMAPEVARGRYGREVDVYSTGIILYELMTGRVPFEGETTAEILMKHLTAEPDLDMLPDMLRPVIAASLEKDPERRISDIEELDRRFRLAVQQSGFAVDKPAPLSASAGASSSKSRSAPAMATTLLGADARRRRSTEAQDQEPRLVGYLRSLMQFWNNEVPRPIKWVVCAIAFVVILNRGIVQLGPREFVVLGIMYAIYRKYYAVTEKDDAESERADVLPKATSEWTPARSIPQSSIASSLKAPPVLQPMMAQAGRTRPVIMSKPTSRHYSPTTVRQISASQRAMDLCISLTVSLVSVIFVTLAVHLATDLLPGTADVAFFGTVALIASCGLIFSAKVWEGRPVDAVVRRLTQGFIGMVVGAAAWGTQHFLMLQDSQLLHADEVDSLLESRVGRITLLDSNGFPTLSCYIAFFGLLFLIRRWWWQADSFRKARFRISTALVTLILGIILTHVLPFPEHLGATWALAISAIVHLSSGWTPLENRLLAPAPDDSLASPALARVRHPVLASPVAQKT